MDGTTSEFGWFSTWVYQNLTVCLTLARDMSWQEMLEAFQEAMTEVPPGSTWQTDGEVGFGGDNEWGWAVETASLRGSDPAVLCRLSRGSREAVSLAYTPKPNGSFWYAREGKLISGYDPTLPNIRWGVEPSRFEAEMERAGLVNGDTAPAASARFLQIAFGITLTVAMLEDVQARVALG